MPSLGFVAAKDRVADGVRDWVWVHWWFYNETKTIDHVFDLGW